jgi:hypothetical protein
LASCSSRPLFSGLPIIYPANTAIDGYFDEMPFALRVDARSPKAIAEAMRHAVENEAEMKRALSNWQQSEEAQRFTQASIAPTFCQYLSDALPKSA